MRIIGGKYKGKVLKAPGDLPVRPTTDFAKTGLFNILTNRFDFTDCVVLDLFAGTGSISLEFISRNIKNIISIDIHHKCIQYLNKNKQLLDIQNWSVIKSDAIKYLRSDKGPYDIIFADPPYDYNEKKNIYDLIFESNLLSKDGLFILEHKTGEDFKLLPGFDFSRAYGNVSFSFFYNFD